MKISNNSNSIIVSNCHNSVINVFCTSTASSNGFLNNSNRFNVNKQQFVTAWMRNYRRGLNAVADALGLTELWTWRRYCEQVANGVNLPRAEGHNRYELSPNEVIQLNEIVNSFSAST